jgi:hypothetical protein
MNFTAEAYRGLCLSGLTSELTGTRRQGAASDSFEHTEHLVDKFIEVDVELPIAASVGTLN